MPVSEGYIRDVDIDNEPDEAVIAQKINSEIQQSRSYWQPFKGMCTELFFDFLAYKESITDKTKSNTAIPLSYIDIMVNKARMKKIILAVKPYARVKPKPYNADLSFKLGHLYTDLLDEAGFEGFLDILIQDACIYPGAVFQVDWGVEYKDLPAFHEIPLAPDQPPLRLPAFDPETGERTFQRQEVREGIILDNIHIQDFYLPKNSKDAETDPWAAKIYSRTLPQLYEAVNPDGSPKYQNLDKLGEIGETTRTDTSELARAAQPVKRDYPSKMTFGKTVDIIEFCTNKFIFHVPEGQDFLILKEKNSHRRKPFHIARVEKLTGEPFGFSPNRANHLMSRTYNEIIDIIMDGLFLEDNKAWVLNEDLVSDFEVGASQGNLIHVHGIEPGMDVRSAIFPIETRAVANEILPLLEKFDQIHQLVGARPNSAAGMPVQGAETAFENALLEQGGSWRILDMVQNLVTTALRPIYNDMSHLLKIHFAVEKTIELLNDNGQLIHQLVVSPFDVYGDSEPQFEFLGKEKAKIEERAAIINLLQVWGNLVNIDPVSVLLMKNLLLNSGIQDMDAIQQALDQSIQQRMMMQQMQMQLAMQKASPAKQGGDKQGSIHQSMSKTANAGNAMKPIGM